MLKAPSARIVTMRIVRRTEFSTENLPMLIPDCFSVRRLGLPCFLCESVGSSGSAVVCPSMVEAVFSSTGSGASGCLYVSSGISYPPELHPL